MSYPKSKYIYILFSLFLTFCSSNSESITKEIKKRNGHDELILGLQIITTTKNATEWVMNSETVKRYNNEKKWVAYKVFLETINEENKNFYQSDSAYISEIDDILTGMGNVIVISPRGKLYTDKIIWNRMKDEIHAPGEIYLKNDDNELWGSNLYTNSNLDYIDLRNVSGKGQADDNIFSE